MTNTNKKFHISLAVKNLEQSIEEYSQKLGSSPQVVIPGEYALWRNDSLNFSIRVDPNASETLRHLGFEIDHCEKFSAKKDGNNILWEEFDWELQKKEIEEAFGS